MDSLSTSSTVLHVVTQFIRTCQLLMYTLWPLRFSSRPGHCQAPQTPPFLQVPSNYPEKQIRGAGWPLAVQSCGSWRMRVRDCGPQREGLNVFGDCLSLLVPGPAGACLGPGSFRGEVLIKQRCWSVCPWGSEGKNLCGAGTKTTGTRLGSKPGWLCG